LEPLCLWALIPMSNVAMPPSTGSSGIWDWTPDAATVLADLTNSVAIDDPRVLMKSFQGIDIGADAYPWFEGFDWVRFTSEHWEVPLTAVSAYFILIPTLRWAVAKYGKWNVRDFAFYWNLSLSLFSWCGLVACVPVLISAVIQKGMYFTVCAPPQWYGNNLSGFFVMLFIYSKVAELLDTVLLLLAKKPVIALQWWHHSTVLLYCWHSYSNCIATGIWFAAMNYSVHAVMYGYFAITATKYRKCVTPFAIFITLAQLLQMLVGMYVTVKAVFHQARGEECHVNKTNSVLGLGMYFSYFVLFFKLFVDNYCMNDHKKLSALPRKPSVSLEVVRKASEKALDDMSAHVHDCHIEKKTA